MSANLAVDLGNATLQYPQIFGGPAFPASGALIGPPVNMVHANTFTNLLVTAKANNLSGQLRVQVQTTNDLSGSWQDPTSGLAAFPTVFTSGTIMTLNSGALTNGTFGALVSGQCLFSGCVVFGGFQRPHQFARTIVLSGDFFTGSLSVGFVAQARTTGSGGGFTLSPTSGVVNV